MTATPKKIEWKPDLDLVMIIRKIGGYHLTSKEREEFLKRGQKR